MYAQFNFMYEIPRLYTGPISWSASENSKKQNETEWKHRKPDENQIKTK